MIKVENIEVFGWEAAIRGMRSPMNSWAKSDSYWGLKEDESPINPCDEVHFFIGKNDIDLMQRLYKGGTEHRKYLRMIHIQMDITSSLYFFKEFDTYKVGTTANSCSTMHKIHAKEFTLEDFSCEHLTSGALDVLNTTIEHLNFCRRWFLIDKNKDWWWQMIQLLPSSYNQKRTVDFSYETAVSMIKQRAGHKLDEWREFVEILKGLPYMKEIMGVEE